MVNLWVFLREVRCQSYIDHFIDIVTLTSVVLVDDFGVMFEFDLQWVVEFLIDYFLLLSIFTVILGFICFGLIMI